MLAFPINAVARVKLPEAQSVFIEPLLKLVIIETIVPLDPDVTKFKAEPNF